MSALPNSTPGLLELIGLSREQAERAVWTIADGERLAGAAAVNRALAELGGGWRRLAAGYRIPGVKQSEDLIYGLVAANRAWLSRLWSDPPKG